MIVYRSDAEGITEQHLAGFFEGWPDPPSPHTHLAVLRNSDEIVLAIDDATGDVVGFVNALTDRVLAAYLPLLEVRASHRGQGIGQELVQRIIDRLPGLYMVDVMCDPDVQPFYAKAGLSPATGSILRRYEHQSGRPLP